MKMKFPVAVLLLLFVGFIRAEPLPKEEVQADDKPEEVEQNEEAEQKTEVDEKAKVEDGSEDQEDEPDQETPKEEEESDESQEKRRIIPIHKYRCKRYYKHCSYLKPCAYRFRRYFCHLWKLCFRYWYGYRYCCRNYYCISKFRWVYKWCYKIGLKWNCNGCRHVCKGLGPLRKCGWYYGNLPCSRRRVRVRYCLKRYVGKEYYC